MKSLDPGLATHLAGGVTTLCRCWRVERKDGTVMGFTDHDRDLKLHVATNYASVAYLKDVEARLVQHLLKIEAKLDRVVEHRPPAE